MNTRALRRIGLIAGVATTSALVLAGCGGTSGGEATTDPNEKVELTIATFNDFGYTDALLAEYTKLHPNVTIVHNKAATSNDARANYFQKLGKTGLADIEAIEIDWMPEVMKYADLLAPVPDDLKGRWLDWKEEGATDADGNLIGYGTDIGPEGVCYRSDLFAAAGLPTDRDEVAALLEGDWSTYFELGDKYTAATGKAFFDSAGGTYQGMVNQLKAAYEDPSTGEITATTNSDVEDIYNEVLDASATQSAHLGQWSDDWFAGLSNGAFATMLCPGWMLGVISGNAPDVTGWDIANVFPNGGGNWGGSYLTVPANGANVAAAQELADWLTSPETQIMAFENAGTFPSQNDALTSDTLLSSTNEYFNNAPVGQILTDRANAVTVSPFKGEFYFQINDAMQKALTRVEDGTQDKATSWAQWVSEVDAIK
ncbi:MAG: ABC transporter substrate-binding protein [Microbacterium sp. SCN 70-200]|uniref:ABC transporter substrate-binding protein n=1 Tax=unclassified Microbacterium TaxID=2609290 RepID=UPI00086C9A7A|nr:MULTISPECIES: ABC transporter substrate-binding protein [unclassified Microbacterium]MBN9215218.1 carbohydrate ABC transporter substrate-binding protein [Microbacterium sp.]ODT42630.1 MAG: ABC transporter substrate-binding protein [Microbacterium sp. SCN 70-200]OJV80027.1 MAG: ABC transporter substrate-binding protein [Microbacterium sp. 70-16]